MPETLFKLKTNINLVLASASPRRKQFLDDWGLCYEILKPQVVEPKPDPLESGADYTTRLASLKAQAVYASLDLARRSSSLIIAADTVVVFQDKFLGKPEDSQAALAMLNSLVGQKHSVTTSVALILPTSGEEVTFSETSQVYFYHFAEDILQSYVASGEPLDKAGAYAIQGLGAFLVEKIEGSWTTVVGLPLCRLAQELLTRGLLVAQQPLVDDA